MQNRQKDELTRDILTVSNGGGAITHIMFKAYLSHAQAKAYLNSLMENGMIEFDALDRKYRTTEKGLEYLRATELMSELLYTGARRSVASKASMQISQF